MATWLEWARGPIFIGAFSFMVLGYLRHLLVTFFEIRRHLRRAGDRTIPTLQIFVATLNWLFPLRKLKSQWLFSATSILFHIAILVVPIFLAGHIVLWARGTGLSWPAIPNHLADVLTLVAIVTAVALVIQRLSARATRNLSRFQDYALPLLIAVPFVTGFGVMHPGVNPFSYDATLLVHVMSANLLLVLMPLSKLSHAVLLPGAQYVSEIGWHWPSDAGSKVAIALNKEGEPV